MAALLEIIYLTNQHWPADLRTKSVKMMTLAMYSYTTDVCR